MIRLAGGRNVLAGGNNPYPTLDAEWVLKLAPEFIIDTSFAEGEGEPADFWAFVGEGPGRPVLRFWSEPEVLRPGPRVVRAVELLRARLVR